MKPKTNIDIKDLPCYECLCLPACRFKTLDELDECELFMEFVPFIPSGDNLVELDEYTARYKALIKYVCLRR